MCSTKQTIGTALETEASGSGVSGSDVTRFVEPQILPFRSSPKRVDYLFENPVAARQILVCGGHNPQLGFLVFYSFISILLQ